LERTEWDKILALYDALFSQQPSEVVELNRAVVVAELQGPERALKLIDGLPLERYHLWHATRANFLDRLGRDGDARAAYRAAAELAPTTAEREFLEGKAQ
jgi:RNA polymerase sigma-70 factor (ECF subfamily)